MARGLLQDGGKIKTTGADSKGEPRPTLQGANDKETTKRILLFADKFRKD